MFNASLCSAYIPILCTASSSYTIYTACANKQNPSTNIQPKVHQDSAHHKFLGLQLSPHRNSFPVEIPIHLSSSSLQEMGNILWTTDAGVRADRGRVVQEIPHLAPYIQSTLTPHTPSWQPLTKQAQSINTHQWSAPRLDNSNYHPSWNTATLSTECQVSYWYQLNYFCC